MKIHSKREWALISQKNDLLIAAAKTVSFQLVTSLKDLPFHCDCKRDEEGDGVGDVVERVDDLGPDVDVDGGGVGDQLEALLQAVLQHGKCDKDRIEYAEHYNQLKKRKHH